MTGEVIFSFSAMYLSELSPHKTPLQFSLSNHDKLSRVLHNQHLMERYVLNVFLRGPTKVKSHTLTGEITIFFPIQ